MRRDLEALGLAEVDLLRRQVGVDDPVEHHPRDVGRELVGVARAEERAVRLAEVVELGVAERRAHHVQVVGGVAGADEAELGPAAGLAARTERLGLRDRGRDLGGSRRRRIGRQELVGLLIGQALHRRAPPDPTRIESDDVVTLPDRIADGRRRLPRIVDPGPTRAAGVDDEGADPVLLVTGRQPDHRQVQRPQRRVGVVDRHGQGGALELVLASLPVQPLHVEGLQLRGDPGDHGWRAGAGVGGDRRCRRAGAGRHDRQRDDDESDPQQT